MKKIILLSTIASVTLMAGAYKIPEQSVNAMALGAAYIAHTTDADTAYYNPANMSFLDPEVRYFETGMTLAHLPSNTYVGMQGGLPGGVVVPAALASGESETENIPIPYMNYVAPAMGRWRYGVSLAAPAGLTKRWKSPVQKLFAEEFTLKNVELNPVVSYRLSDTFSIGGGLRAVYSEGKVYSDGSLIGLPIKREMEGDTVEFGYNLALAWHPSSDIAVGITYRSKIDLNEEGEANLYLAGAGKQYKASVSVPIPAALNIGISKTWDDRVTLEFVYERTFWSAYKTLDFEYGSPILNPTLSAAFDEPKDKLWEDTNSFRIGLTYQYSDKLTLMAGYSYDETPVPEKHINYELPDSDAHIFSAGFKYQYSDSLTFGAALLYDKKTSRKVNSAVAGGTGLIGEFSDGGAVLATVGLSYKF